MLIDQPNNVIFEYKSQTVPNENPRTPDIKIAEAPSVPQLQFNAKNTINDDIELIKTKISMTFRIARSISFRISSISFRIIAAQCHLCESDTQGLPSLRSDEADELDLRVD